MSLLFAIFLLAFGNVEVTYGSLILPYCVRHLKMTEKMGNRVAFSYWLSMAASRLTLVFVGGKVVPERLLTASVVVATASMAAATVLAGYPTAGSWSAWPCSVLLGLGGATVFPGSIALAAVYVGGASSRLLALLVSTWTTGCVVGPMVAGLLFQRFGPVWVVRYALAASAFSAIMFLVIRRTHARLTVERLRHAIYHRRSGI